MSAGVFAAGATRAASGVSSDRRRDAPSSIVDWGYAARLTCESTCARGVLGRRWAWRLRGAASQRPGRELP